MKTIFSPLLLLFIAGVFFISCEKETEDTEAIQEEVSPEILNKLEESGFDITNKLPIKYEEGYIVEGDIFMTHKDIMTSRFANTYDVFNKQYSTNNLVSTNGNRTINVFIQQGGFSGFDSVTVAAAELAIERYNQQNLDLTFRRVFSSSNADIRIVRQFFLLDFLGVLGSAGFPTATGNPFNQISLSGGLRGNGFDVNGIATIVAHEMGHCIGFRHTDFFDRSVSCGGTSSPEGDGGVGADQIPGTPSGASLEDGSWMLACSDGGDRPFNEDDITALNFLY